MTGDLLDLLGDYAPRWARAYVRLKDSLLREGVVPEEAIDQARTTATEALWNGALDEDGEGREPWQG